MRAFFLSSAVVAAGAAMLVVAAGVAFFHTNARDRAAEARAAAAAASAPPELRVHLKPAKLDVTAAIEAYRKGPNEDRTLAVWEAFEDLDAKIAKLRHTVATTIGGQRAEAEVDRIELQLHRDAEMARFQGFQERWEAALMVINGLQSSTSPTPRPESAGWISSRQAEREAGRQESPGLKPPARSRVRFEPATSRIEGRGLKLAGKIAMRA
jgi:hypothetical protein